MGDSMAKNYDEWIANNAAKNRIASDAASGAVIDESGPIGEGVGFENLTQNQNVVGLPGSDMAKGAGGLSLAKANPKIAAAALALDTINKAYEVKNANAMARYQAKLADFNNRQKALERLSRPMAV